MSRQITEQETQELFEVCKRHGVLQYDVQIELVDHLASLIEQHWAEKPEDPFKYALYKAFQKFGPVGFKQVKEQKQGALAQKYRRMLWHYLLEFYRWPKLFLTLALSLALAFLFRAANGSVWMLAPCVATILIGAAVFDYRYKTTHKIKTTPGKSFLLLEQLKQIQFVALLFGNLPLVLYIVFDAARDGNLILPTNYWPLFLIALFVVSVNILMFAYFFISPKK